MTLATRYNEKKLVEKELYHKLNTHITIYIILIGCLGVATATLISIVYGSATFMTPFSSSPSSEKLATYLGSVSGFVISSDSLPVDRASVVVYKHMGLIDSADKNVGYFASVATEPDGSFVLSDLPSGVYKITVTHPTGAIQTINNYAIWPSSASSYVFVAK
ncbi:MAG: carboxypeptidase-like regulatory domain-containing protein [Nitrososphaeraceae archaeon]|jgi:hypothetical protein